MSNLLKDRKAALEKVGRKAQEKAAANGTKVETKKRKKRKTSSVNATSDNEHNDLDEALSQKNILSTNETLLVGMNHTNVTAFNPPDPLLVASRMFGSDGSKSSIEPNLNATYGTTIGFILILHLVFAYQWNKRKSRREVLTSYHQLVTKKQIHRSVVALVSHPPADASFLSRERLVSLAIEMGDSNHTTEYGRLGRLRNKLKSFVSALHPLTYGHLSGLPLLAYNSHLLWSCRALEALCPSSWYYARFLIALALVSYLLELRLSYNLLQTSRELGGLPGFPSHSRRTIKHRTMGTPTMVTAGVLLIYHVCFPFVSLPILPFLPVSRRMDVTLSYIMCFTLLTALSWKSHPVTCILCGISSGFLWVFGVTSFLGEPYWGSCMICWIVLASLLTLRVKFAGWLPWIDYVAWDDRGRIRYEEPNLGEEQETEGEEEEQPPEDDIESRPLLTRRSESSGLRGRVPLMDMDDDIEMPRSSPSRGLQQRRGGPESSSHHRYQ
jgi:hypothetical protein